MKIVPLASESLGARSMAVGIEAEGLRILIDPGVAYAPRRFGLRPHPVEMRRLEELSKAVESYGRRADVIVITHYHRDHFDFGNRISLEIYRGKTVFIKHPEENINPKQRFKRARVLLKKLQSEEYAPARIEFADGREFVIGGVKLKFSRPLPHGRDTKLGYVISLLVEAGGERVLFTSDVQGILTKEQLSFILSSKPDILILDGPPTYLLGHGFDEDVLKVATENTVRVIREVRPQLVLLDHHLLRDAEYRSAFSGVYELAESLSVPVISYAEYLGRPVEAFEARRRELYEQIPVEEGECGRQ